MFGVNRKLAIVANEMKGNIAKMGPGNTSVTQSRKAFFSDLCCVGSIFTDTI